MKHIGKALEQSLKALFISHMVQMKLIMIPAFYTRQSLFISHMVQMKHKSYPMLPSVFLSFISHMVQMKQF